MNHDIPALRALAVSLATSAGDLIRERRPDRATVADTKTSATDPVTEMDRSIEEYLVAEILRARPDDAVLGEEGNDVAGTSGLTWVIDPIDGTVNYLYGIASFAVSVAVVVGPPHPEWWTVLAGCVHDVVTGRTWSAGCGQGAGANGVPLTPVAPAPLSSCLTGTGFGYDSARRARQAQVLTKVLPRVRDIRRLGSAAVDLCLLAEGTLDLYYERGLNPWDMAAGSLIAAENGAEVVGLRGTKASGEMTVAGRGPAVRELLNILEAADADRD
ncbi:MAG: inositol monophosphatase [Promicromonosporaceae bacterium]|nr:inositol monophosphatase [Promicromonosporaceae bacterium]